MQSNLIVATQGLREVRVVVREQSALSSRQTKATGCSVLDSRYKYLTASNIGSCMFHVAGGMNVGGFKLRVSQAHGEAMKSQTFWLIVKFCHMSLLPPPRSRPGGVRQHTP